jgi:acyl dehydratase
VKSGVNIDRYIGHIGKDYPQPQQYLYEVTRDGIRNFAYAIPDHSGLYIDGEYAATTRWGSPIAPPGYLYAFGSPAWLSKLDGIVDAEGNELTNGDNATEQWDFHLPVRPGDTILSHGKVVGAEIKQSRKLGDAVLVNEEMRYTNQRGERVATLTSYSFRFNNAKAASGGEVASGYPPMEPGQFTRNQATPPRLPGTFPQPEPRYDARRYFEDVAIGEVLPSWTLPRLKVADIAMFNAETTGGGYDRIGRMGHIPDSFAPGVLRIQWFGSLMMRWGGPDSFVRHIAQRNEDWVLVGFDIVFSGTVTGKSVIDGRGIVEIALACHSELGFRTNSGIGRLELPLRGTDR